MATQVYVSAPPVIRPPTIPTALQPPPQTQPVSEDSRPDYQTLQQDLAIAQHQRANTKRQLTKSERQLAKSEQQLAKVKRQWASTKRQLASTRRQLAKRKRQLATTKRQLARSEQLLAIERAWRQWAFQALGSERAARLQLVEQSLQRIQQAEQDQAGICLICFRNRKNVVFLPCAHMMVCHDCGPGFVRMLPDYRCPALGCNCVISSVLVTRDVPLLGDTQFSY